MAAEYADGVGGAGGDAGAAAGASRRIQRRCGHWRAAALEGNGLDAAGIATAHAEHSTAGETLRTDEHGVAPGRTVAARIERGFGTGIDAVAAKRAAADTEVHFRVAVVADAQNAFRASVEAIAAARAGIREISLAERPRRAHRGWWRLQPAP